MLARRALSALARRASSSSRTSRASRTVNSDVGSPRPTTNGIVADSFARGRRERSDDATETANDTQDASDVEAVAAFLRRAGVDEKHAEALGTMESVMGIKTHNAKKKGLNVKERKALLRWRERVRAGLESA